MSNDCGNDNDKDVGMIRRNCYSNEDDHGDAVHDDVSQVDGDLSVHSCVAPPFFSRCTQEDVIPTPTGIT